MRRKSLWGDSLVKMDGIIRAMCAVSNFTKEEAHLAHNLIMAIIFVQLEYGNSVELAGVGKLVVTQLPERKGKVRDPNGLRSKPGNWGNRYMHDVIDGILPPMWQLRFSPQKRVKAAMKTGPERKKEREITKLIKQYC